jgi:hypothetical protein
VTPRKRRLVPHLSHAYPQLVASRIIVHLAGVLNREERADNLCVCVGGGGGGRAYGNAAAFV